MEMTWLLCSYRLPRDPTRLRLAIWRRMKRVGAVVLHDSLWVLPADAKTREDFDWLAEEIEERSGSVLLWDAQSLPSGQDAELIRRFQADAEARYATIRDAAAQLTKLGRRHRLTARSLEQALQRLRVLERAFRLERRRDYFSAPGQREAREIIEAAMNEIRSRKELGAARGKTHAVGN